MTAIRGSGRDKSNAPMKRKLIFLVLVQDMNKVLGIFSLYISLSSVLKYVAPNVHIVHKWMQEKDKSSSIGGYGYRGIGCRDTGCRGEATGSDGGRWKG